MFSLTALDLVLDKMTRYRTTIKITGSKQLSSEANYTLWAVRGFVF